MKQILSDGRGATPVGSPVAMVATGRGAPARAKYPAYHVCRRAGFTLLELMIVVAIVAILAAIAYPSYTHYIIKTRRAAAEGCLSEYANYMERYYTTNLRYDTSTDTPPVANELPALDCASTAQTGNYYSYTFGNLTASDYTINAAPTGAQVADTECGTLSLDQGGTRTPADTSCW